MSLLAAQKVREWEGERHIFMKMEIAFALGVSESNDSVHLKGWGVLQTLKFE